MTRLLLPLVVAATVWMTHYSIPGGTMRNGQPFDDNALVCAVDDSAWVRATDTPVVDRLTVCASGDSDKSRGCVAVEICDSGYLAPYGIALDCTKAVWRTLGLRLGLGRARVIVYDD